MSINNNDKNSGTDTFFVKRSKSIPGVYEVSYFNESMGVAVGTGNKSVLTDSSSIQGLELLGMIYDRLTHSEVKGNKEMGFREQQNGNPSKPNSSFEVISSDETARVILDSALDLEVLMTAKSKKEELLKDANLQDNSRVR